MTHRTKPLFSWEQFKQMNPTTAYDHLTYASGSFTRREAGTVAVGDTFKHEGFQWRVIAVTKHPFSPIRAVPATYVEKFWE